MTTKVFFIAVYPTPKEGDGTDAGTETNINLDHELFYHFLGTNKSKNIHCWKDSEHPKWTVDSEKKIREYVLLCIIEGCDPVNRLFNCELTALPQGFKGKKEVLPFHKLIDNFKAQYELIANGGFVFCIL